MTHSPDSINWLKQLTELRETGYLTRILVYYKGYERSARWKGMKSNRVPNSVDSVPAYQGTNLEVHQILLFKSFHKAYLQGCPSEWMGLKAPTFYSVGLPGDQSYPETMCGPHPKPSH